MCSPQKRKEPTVDKAIEVIDGWVYETSEDNKYRYILGKPGRSNLVCVGVNPSRAKPGDLDPTMVQLKNRAAVNGYDGFIMVNLWPERSTDPNGITDEPDESIFRKNAEYVRKACLYGDFVIWAAWGNLIETKPYLVKGLREIVSELGDLGFDKWRHVGPLTKKDHPHHPLFLATNASFEPFVIEDYLQKIDAGKHPNV